MARPELAYRTVREVVPGDDRYRCVCDEGHSFHVAPFLGCFLQVSDRLAPLGAADQEVHTDFLVERGTRQAKRTLLSAGIGHVTQPKAGRNGASYVRAEMPIGAATKAIHIDTSALRRYFYLLEENGSGESLYGVLGITNEASPADLRLAWRLRSVELNAGHDSDRDRVRAERAFNVLAHPDLRTCYDALLRSPDAPALFPYGGHGWILVEGQLSPDADIFFGCRIIAYRPEMSLRRLTLLLRRGEFLADRVVCRDPRRKVEVWLDGGLLPLRWDVTWNQWKHWLKSRIEVEATLVHAGRYRLHQGEWRLVNWQAALPSRLQVTLPENLADDIEQAKAIHALLGEHAAVVERIRKQVESHPVEHTVIARWFDELAVSPRLKPQHVTWRPDYEPFYFDQLREKSRSWFLIRDEYLFDWEHALVAEIPQPGHATYIYRRPENLEDFLCRYARATRKDVRQNRDNVGRDLGFVGRVVRGRKKKRWLADVLKQADQSSDYVESFD